MTRLVDGLSEVISVDLQRVEAQGDQYNRTVGLKTIMFATFARRSLSIEEVRRAVELLVESEIREASPEFSSELPRLTIEDLIEYSCGLLRVNHQNNAVLVDKATMSYCRRYEKFQKAHYEIAQMCLAFLDSMSFALRSKSPNPKDNYEGLLKKFPLYSYAVQYWNIHVKQAGEHLFFKKSSPVSLFTLLSRKLFCNALASANYNRFPGRVWNWNNNDTWKSLQDFEDPVVPAAHLLVFFDLPRTLNWWLRQSPHQVECRTVTGMTPLYMACLHNRIRAAEILLFDYRADPTAMGSPPLGYCLAAAVFAQSPEMVQRVLYAESRKTLELTNWHKRRPLGEAVMRGNMDIVKMLLEATAATPNSEAQLLMPDQGGVDALHEVAMAPDSSIKAIDLLVESKGGKAFLYSQTTKWRDTALHLAAIRGRHKIVKHLLDLGADPSKGQSLQQTPLMLAVQGLHAVNEETINRLMSVTKDYDMRDVDGRTIWHHAARMARPNNIAQLIRLTPKDKSLFNATNKNGETPIRDAVILRRDGWTHCILVLLRDCPRQISAEDAYAVLNALIPDRSEVTISALELLIDQYPVESWPYCRGQTTLLHKILHNGSPEMARMAWEKLGTESSKVLEYRDAGGSTPLVLSAGASNPIGDATTKAKFLLDNGANVDARDNCGRTALHHAVARDLSALVAALLGKGSDYRIKNNHGVTALESMAENSQCAKAPEVIAIKDKL